MKAGDIDDGAIVRKVTGENTYCLKKQLKVYTQENKTPLVIDGIFLIGDRGHINQVLPGKKLVVIMSAEDAMEWLSTELQGTEQ